MKRPTAIGTIVAALVLSGCGGDDNKATTSPEPADTVEAPQTTPPPAAAGQLPPEFLKCMADKGYKIQSPAEIHSEAPQVLQACFQSLHGGGTP